MLCHAALQLTPFQVPTHAIEHGQSRGNRPRPLSQCEPGPRALLLRPAPDFSSSVFEKHLHSSQARLSFLRGTPEQRWPTHSLGRPWCAFAEHLSYRESTRGQLARRKGLGEVHAKGHRYCCSQEDQGCRLLGLGHSCPEENCCCQFDQASYSQECAPESIECSQRLRTSLYTPSAACPALTYHAARLWTFQEGQRVAEGTIWRGWGD